MLSSTYSFALAIILALVWYYTIKKTATGFINIQQYLGIFLILIPTMVLVISIIKASLALSLGLVGALSIVRFRTPIKDPSELMYIFVAIAVGLGLGAGQHFLTIYFMVVVCLVLFVYSRVRGQRLAADHNMLLEVTVSDQNAVTLSDVQEVLSANGMGADVQRLSGSGGGGTYVFNVTEASPVAMEKFTSTLSSRDHDATVTFFNTSHVIA